MLVNPRIREDFIFDPSLVLYLPLYKPDGASFMSGDAYGHLCTVTGALWQSNGRLFDGINDKIALGALDAFNLGTHDFTLEAWVNTSDKEVYPLGKWQDDNNRWYFRIEATVGYIFVFGKAGGVTLLNINGTTGIADGSWHHMVVTGIRGVRGYVYLDSVDDSSGTVTCSATDMDNTAALEVGKYTADFYDGLIGELRMYNRALNPMEVQHNYLATKWRYK